jgi:hypothetical protein
MRRTLDIRAFLTRHSDARVIGQIPTMPWAAMPAPEAEFKRRLLTAGFSGSYFTLLGLTATLTVDAGKHLPEDDASQPGEAEWHGYHRGLQTALACLAMHETGYSPRQVALLVVEHTEALIRCRWADEPAVRFSGDG